MEYQEIYCMGYQDIYGDIWKYTVYIFFKQGIEYQEIHITKYQEIYDIEYLEIYGMGYLKYIVWDIKTNTVRNERKKNTWYGISRNLHHEISRKVWYQI